MRSPDWNLYRAFHATATAGSLSAAARKIGLTQPTLSRQVQALEEQLGVRLFERPGRKLVLTETGRAVLEHIQTMGDAAQAAGLTAGGQTRELRGRVSISASDALAAYLLPRIVKRIRLDAPGLLIDIVPTDDLIDLHQQEADIAIRHVEPDRPGLVAQHVGNSTAHFYAASEWVAQNGEPQTLAELAGACLLGFGDIDRYSGQLASLGIGISAADFRLASRSSTVVWEMVRCGLGVAPMMRHIAELTPGIKRLLPDLEPIPVPVWLVTHEALLASPRIRLVRGILAEELLH